MPVVAPVPPRLPRAALGSSEKDAALAEGHRLLRAAAMDADRWVELRNGIATEADRRAVLESLRLDAQEATRNVTSRLLEGSLSRDSWQRRMRAILIPRHYAAALAVSGDPAAPGAAARRDVEAIIRRQLGFLGRFRSDLAFGLSTTGGRELQRADLYGAAVWATGQEVRRKQARREGFDEEASVLGLHDHCGDCLSEAARGWVAIGSLIPIGGRICRSHCGCHLIFRKAA